MEGLRKALERFDRSNPQRSGDSQSQDEFKNKIKDLGLDVLSESTSRIDQEKVEKSLRKLKTPKVSLYEKNRQKRRQRVINEYLKSRRYSEIVGYNQDKIDKIAHNRYINSLENKELRELEKKLPPPKREDVEKWDKYNKDIDEEAKRTKLSRGEAWREIKNQLKFTKDGIKLSLKGGPKERFDGHIIKESKTERAKNALSHIASLPRSIKGALRGLKYQKAGEKIKLPELSSDEKARDKAFEKIYKKYKDRYLPY